MSTSYGLINELSRNEKLQKYRIILSRRTISTNEFVHLNFYYCHVYFFLQNFWICPSLELSNLRLYFEAHLSLTRSHAIRNFLANEIYHFSRLSHQTGCLFSWAAHSIWSASYSGVFTFCLFQNSNLQKMLKLEPS